MSRVILAAVIAASSAAPVMAQTAAPQPPVIVTQGEASLKRAPDRAWVTVSTETRDARAAEARTKDAAAMTAVQDALKAAGVLPDAIRTVGYSLSPEMDWNNGRGILRGHVVRNQVEVRVDDLDALPDVLDAANSPRGVALSIRGPRFDLQDERAVQNEALRQAVEAALSRAEAMAAGAGRSLGPILRIEEQYAGPVVPRPKPMAMRAAAGVVAEVATPITPGEIEIRVQVTLTVEIR